MMSENVPNRVENNCYMEIEIFFKKHATQLAMVEKLTNYFSLPALLMY